MTTPPPVDLAELAPPGPSLADQLRTATRSPEGQAARRLIRAAAREAYQASPAGAAWALGSAIETIGRDTLDHLDTEPPTDGYTDEALVREALGRIPQVLADVHLGIPPADVHALGELIVHNYPDAIGPEGGSVGAAITVLTRYLSLGPAIADLATALLQQHPRQLTLADAADPVAVVIAAAQVIGNREAG